MHRDGSFGVTKQLHKGEYYRIRANKIVLSYHKKYFAFARAPSLFPRVIQNATSYYVTGTLAMDQAKDIRAPMHCS